MTLDAGQIRASFGQVRERIRTAATNSGRDPDAVRLVAVTKRMPADAVRAALAAGHACFGENTVQDAATKQDVITDPAIEWHFIGHLQSNKAAAVAARFDWLHTLDSLKLARRLSAARPDERAPLRVLLQVNVADDPDKAGIPVARLTEFTEQLLAEDLPGVELCGLMTIGRRQVDDAARRLEFDTLHRLGEECALRFGRQYFAELSMGMSDDYELAILAGATLVRVGSGLFGARPG